MNQKISQSASKVKDTSEIKDYFSGLSSFTTVIQN